MEDTTAGASLSSDLGMRTFDLPGWDTAIPVTHDSGITQAEILNFKAFEDWQKTLKSSLRRQKFSDHEFNADPYELKAIEIQSYDLVGSMYNKPPFFIKLKARVENAKGAEEPGIVFLRGGGTVAVLIIIRPTDSLEERYVIMAEQPRVAIGSLRFMAIPVGMMDYHDDNFVGVAARELKAELGIELKGNDLINMIELALKGDETEEPLQNAMYMSPSGSDESVGIYLWEGNMDRMQIDGLRSLLDSEKDGEPLRLRLLEYEKLLQVGARDAKTLAAWSLYEYLKRTRQIK